jgi:hypothetical protein
MKRMASELDEKDFKLVNGFLVPTTCEEEKLSLALKYPHPNDKLIIFAETIPNSEEHHKYFIRGNNEYCSVSQFYSQFFHEFDNIGIASKMISREDFFTNDRYQEYWGMVNEETSMEENIDTIVKHWKDYGDLQSSLGTSMHREIELWCNSSDVKMELIDPACQHFLKLHQDLKDKNQSVFRTEMMMFDDDSKICGCADVIFIDDDELTNENILEWQKNTRKLKVHLGDWKRSKKIEKCGYGKTGIEPCNTLPSANYYKYSLQLNLYRYILEKNYNFEVLDMTIYVFHPNNDCYLDFVVTDYQELVMKMIDKRIKTF